MKCMAIIETKFDIICIITHSYAWLCSILILAIDVGLHSLTLGRNLRKQEESDANTNNEWCQFD